MKKLLVLYFFTCSMIRASCLHVSTHDMATCEDGTIIIENIYSDFKDSLSLTTDTVLDIPIFVSMVSDESTSVQMKLSGLSKLSQDTQNIEIFYYYVTDDGKKIHIDDSQPFTLLTLKDKYHGKVGDIRIIVKPLIYNETAGIYSTKSSTSVSLDTQTAQSTIQIKAKVDEVVRVSFLDNVKFATSGIGFLGAEIDLGTVKLHTKIENNVHVYVRNNTKLGCTMSIEPTPLVHTVYPDQKYASINLIFAYTPNGGTQKIISGNTEFILTKTKNYGDAVGTFSFSSKSLDKLYLAGEYESVIHVTIKAR